MNEKKPRICQKSQSTVFVLGAGASVPYNYPLGRELIHDIVADINDTVFIHVPDDEVPIVGKKKSFNFSKSDFKENKLYPLAWNDRDCIPCPIPKDDLFRSAVAELKHSNFFKYNDAYFFKTSIRGIFGFNALREALIEFAPVSIDTFLRDNPIHSEAGKTMIVYSLLKRENKDSFKLEESQQEVCQGCGRKVKQQKCMGCGQKKEGNDNWYAYLLNDLVSGCADNPRKLLKNKLTIITFNYDVSLDWYLHHNLSNKGIFSSENRSVIQKFFGKKLKMHHVYGSIYDPKTIPNHLDYGSFLHKEENASKWELGRFLHSYRLRNNIHTMYCERSNQNGKNKKLISQYQNALKYARNIVFIGFGFDRDNLNQLGLPNTQKAWEDFCWNSVGNQKTNKKRELIHRSIRWLNYLNSMNGLSEQFNQLNQGRKRTVIESKANNISNAYQNDLRLFLY